MLIPEEFDKEKIAKMALAVLSLSRMKEPYGGVSVWKGLDWNVMDLLYEKGWISNPVGKQKSVSLSESGTKIADQILEEHFTK